MAAAELIPVGVYMAATQLAEATPAGLHAPGPRPAQPDRVDKAVGPDTMWYDMADCFEPDLSEPLWAAAKKRIDHFTM